MSGLPYEVNDRPVMVCGHLANAVRDGKPACAVHGGTTDLADDQTVKPTGWLCVPCGRTSENPVAFADVKDRTHYDGCYGWN